MEQKFPLLYTIERMRQRSFDLHNSSSFNLKSDLATYVPLNCSSGPRDTSEFPLKNTIVKFLEENCSQKVLLLHGNAGSGKSLFGRWLESYLWELFIQGNNESVIPVFVSLASLKDPSRGVIEESLTSQGFSNKQINNLRESDSQQRMLFILDGFDEINCKQIYMKEINLENVRTLK